MLRLPLPGFGKALLLGVRFKRWSPSAIRYWQQIPYSTRRTLHKFNSNGLGLAVVVTGHISFSVAASALFSDWFLGFSLWMIISSVLRRASTSPLDYQTRIPQTLLETVTGDDVRRLMLNVLLSGDAAEETLERVRLELGDADYRALTMLVSFPDHADAPKGGEAQELLARVADLLQPVSNESTNSVQVAFRSKTAG